jgi:hypothetical protein
VGGRPYFNERGRVPIFQTRRKKTLRIRAIFGTLWVQKALKSLKPALLVIFDVFKTIFT